MKNIINLTVAIILLISFTTEAQNNAPVVTNVTFTERTDGSFMVDIHYDVNDADNDTMTVTMKVSSDAGQTWNFTANNITGDVGAGILSGTGKHIVWDFGAEHPLFYNNQIGIKIIADDNAQICGGTITYAGQIYNTVLIGSQCWFKENLNVGTMITSNDTSDNQTNNGIIEKYCYDNDTSNCYTFGNSYQWGGLYQWNEAMQYVTTEGAQGICPTGWHIPTYADMQTLNNSVGGIGNALKEIGSGSGNGAGTNTSGFSALLVGERSASLGYFVYLGARTFIWTSKESSNTAAYYLYLNYNQWNVFFNYADKRGGFSVRCLKD